MNNRLQETLDFIYQIKDRPALWYHGHNLHSDKVVCDALWESIGNRFNISGPSAKSRWKNLRDNFRRELRRSALGLSGQTPEEYNSPWRYFQHMFFIKDQLRQPSSSTEPTTTIPQNKTPKKFEPIPSTSKAPNQGIIMDDEIEVVETTHDAFVTEFKKAPPPKASKSRRDESKCEMLEKQIAEAMLVSVDPDVGFLASLLPHVRAVPPLRKAMMKHHLLEVLVQYLDNDDIDEPVEVIDETNLLSSSDESEEASIVDHEGTNEIAPSNTRKRKSVQKPEPEAKRANNGNVSFTE